MLKSYNISLKYLFDQQNLNSRYTRWLSFFLSEYDFEIKHNKGKENEVEDALTRHENMLYVTASSRYETDLEDKIENATKFDKDYLKLKEKTPENEVNHEFILNKKGLLLHKRRLYIPNLKEIKLIFMVNYIKDRTQDILDIRECLP